MSKRIVFTGGSGKAGRHVVPYLLDKGHEVLNLDLVPLDHEGVNTVVTDLTDGGQVFNALSMHFDTSEFASGTGPAPVDAVVPASSLRSTFLRLFPTALMAFVTYFSRYALLPGFVADFMILTVCDVGAILPGVGHDTSSIDYSLDNDSKRGRFKVAGGCALR
ncbi:MAG: dehydratase [Devosia sp.]|nr:dehydratase [Devosia sp.]